MYNRGKGKTRALRKMPVNNRDEKNLDLEKEKIVIWKKTITRALENIYMNLKVL